MKNKTSIILVAISIVVFAGCATPVYTPVVTPATATNPAQTNNVVTAYIPNATTQTASTLLQAVSGALPAPFSTATDFAGWLLGALGVGAAAYANAKKVQHLNTLNAVTAGIETALPGIMGTGLNAQQASAALAAVKTSVTGATNANGTQTNLQNVLANSALS